MENKTISYLNGKAWYRLFKVVYVLLFLFISVVAIAIISDIHGERQDNDYRVICNYGNKTNFLAHGDESILLSDYDLRNGLADIPSYEKDELRRACGTTDADYDELFNQIKNKAVEVKPLYTITKEKIKSGGLVNVICYSFLAILLIALVFEIVKRIFYYVVLGSLKPTK